MRDNEARRVSKAKISLMQHPDFALWSGILTSGQTYVVEDLPTAATDGIDEFYGRDFINTLTDKQLAFVVLHENLHKGFRHMFVWRKLHEENPRLANMACDYVINLVISDADPERKVVDIPTQDGKPFILLDEKYRGMNTKQVYDLLKQEQEKKKQDGEGKGKGKGEAKGGGEENFDSHDWEKAKGLSKEQREELEREIDRGLRQGQMAAKRVGKGAGNTPRELGELLEPQVDWKEEMREFVKSICAGRDMSSWRKPNRRYMGQGMVMPSMISERIGRVVVGVDTSGSIGVGDLNTFLSEVKALASELHPEFVDLMYWDTRVAAHEVYDVNTLDTLVQSTKPAGGGGTDPQCVVDKIKEEGTQPECVVMLTDGHVPDWGVGWDAPVLWVVAGNPSATATVGKTVHINN